jgi:hypothetical protein
MKNYIVSIEVDDDFNEENDVYESEIPHNDLSLENLYAAFEAVLVIFGYSEEDIMLFYNQQIVKFGEN